MQPSDSLQGVIGEEQDIICSITITSTIDSDSVELTWTNADSIITADNRVAIETDITENPFSFTYTTTVKFAYLKEGDEGNYTCNVRVGVVMRSRSAVLQYLRGMKTSLPLKIFLENLLKILLHLDNTSVWQ